MDTTHPSLLVEVQLLLAGEPQSPDCGKHAKNHKAKHRVADPQGLARPFMAQAHVLHLHRGTESNVGEADATLTCNDNTHREGQGWWRGAGGRRKEGGGRGGEEGGRGTGEGEGEREGRTEGAGEGRMEGEAGGTLSTSAP